MSAAVDQPYYLALLLVLPVLWWGAYRSLSGLGKLRRFLALGLRGVVFTLIVLALAEFQWVWKSDRLTVIYLLDQSLSIPEPYRRAMTNYVNKEVERHRNGAKGDRAGVIVFAKDAAVEYPAMDSSLQLTGSFESPINPEYTNLTGALNLAQAMFPIDSAKRLVIVTDGNENLGNALQQSQAMSESGIGIDVVPVRYAARSDITVEKLVAPADMQRGQPFNLRVVLSNSLQANQSGAKPIKGKVKVFRRTKDHEEAIADESVTVNPGKQVFTLNEKIDAADFYTYEARFVPDSGVEDLIPQNNQATAFTHVRGQGQVLLVEDFEHQGEFNHLVEQLRRANLQVTVMPTNELFASMAELQAYDTVILANVPREAFSDDQIKLLVNNTQQMGSGLVMLGGPNSFGAGGWNNSELEAAMPVDFQVKSAKVVPIGALALVIDRSGSMAGDKLVMARAAAIAAVDVLSPRDYVSVSAFDSIGYSVVPSMRVEKRDAIKARIHRLDTGGGTNMEPGIELAYKALKQPTDAAIRHMLILTDGQTSGSGYERMMVKYKREGITVSTVAVGLDADQQLLQRMAVAGGGKFYHATTPRILPQIFQKEARLVSRPLVYENKNGMRPQLKFPHEMLKGIDEVLPPFTGYVLTQVKDNPLVEVALVAPVPAGEDNRTLLAAWTYGLGKAVAFTSDAGRRWTNQWNDWPNQEKFFAQVVRWSMRASGTQGDFTVTTSTHNGKAEVIVDALNKDRDYLDFLNVGARVVGPDLKPRDLEIQQTAPGRYRGEFNLDEAGSYFLTLVPDANSAPIVTGMNVGYSQEYVDRETNESLLSALASLRPKGGEPGIVIGDTEKQSENVLGNANASAIEPLLAIDTFRRTLAPASARQDIWPQLLLVASCLFFADVFVRRVRLNLDWLPAYTAKVRDWMRRRETQPAFTTMDRLKGRKAEVTESLEARRETVQFSPTSADSAGTPLVEIVEAGPATGPSATPVPPAKELAAEGSDEETYTSRLLKAKRKVWDDK